MSDLIVGVIWWQFEFEDEAINFVNAESDRQFFLNRMSKKSFCVKHNPFCGIDE